MRGEAQPGGQTAGNAGAQDAECDGDLAARRPGQELTKRDDIDVGGFIQPLAPLDELGAEISQMRDRAAEAREPEPEKTSSTSRSGQRCAFAPATRSPALTVDPHLRTA